MYAATVTHPSTVGSPMPGRQRPPSVAASNIIPTRPIDSLQNPIQSVRYQGTLTTTTRRRPLKSR